MTPRRPLFMGRILSLRPLLVLAALLAGHFLPAQVLQQTECEKKSCDSLEVLYQKAPNDTMRIYLKFQQQKYYDRYDPEKAVRNAFKYFSIAKRSNHPMSMIRCY